MQNGRLYCLIFALLILWIMPTTAQESPLLFEANFDDATMPESLHVQYGTYDIQDGNLSYTVANGGFLLIPEGITWTDYAIEARLRIISGSVWLQARTGGDLCSGYYLTLNLEKELYDLSIADRECNFTIVESRESAGITSDWLVARIEVVGNQISTSIDETELFSTVDDQYASGYPTVNIFAYDDDDDEHDAQVEFDYIRVIDLSVSGIEVTEEAPTPHAEATDDIEAPDAEVTEDAPTPEPESIELPIVNEVSLSDDPTRTIETLRELDLIPAGVGDLYQEDVVVISRVGTWFEPIFDDLSNNNVVMSGDIRFLPYSEGESCLLSVRMQRDEVGVAQRYLDVGINSRNEVFIGEVDDNGNYNQASQDGLLNQPDGNILLIARGNRVSVYLDGNAVFQNVEVTPREGGVGVSSIATTSYTICRVNNLWAYTFDD